ncbi:lytic murein transglycosylase B [soil metagenome]
MFNYKNYKKITTTLLLSISLLAITNVVKAAGVSDRPDVQQFINHMVKTYHFNKTELQHLFQQVNIDRRVLPSIKAPMEAVPWYRYKTFFLTPKRIQEGAQFWQQNTATLAEAEHRYGVPASIIVAILGVESNYGSSQGKFKVIDSLTTLSFEYPKRAKFFRSELEQFLLLTREQHFNPLEIRGSYAGAMGQGQFMPSSYRSYAVDFTGDGKKDLFHNTADAIGSVANYMKRHGWYAAQPVALEAYSKTSATKLNTNFSYSQRKPTMLPLSQIKRYGLYTKQKLPSDIQASIIKLEGAQGMEYWLGFHNFNVIMRYNPSARYAMAVYQLGEAVKATTPQRQS